MDQSHQQAPQQSQEPNQPSMYYYDDSQQYNMTYSPGAPHHVYQNPSVIQPAVHQPMPIQTTHIPHQTLQYHSHGMLVPQHQHHQPFSPYDASPPRAQVSLPHAVSPPPPSPTNYDPLSPSVSGGSDTSADGIYHHSNSSGALSPPSSPSSSRGSSLVHRNRTTHRYNPTPSPTSSSSDRRTHRGRSQEQDSDELDDEAMGVNYSNRGDNLASTRKEATRRQRIEAEQRRRDELRDGYAKLKDVLPTSNLKSSKVSLLERATNHIISLETENKQLQDRIDALEEESDRLRSLNEKMSLGSDDIDVKQDPAEDDGTPSPPGMVDPTFHQEMQHHHPHQPSPSPSADSVY